MSAPAYGGPPLARHPQAQTALVLGIVSLGGTFTCVLPIFLAPFAWYFAAKVRREIAGAPNRWSGGTDATAGMILGIISSVLLALVVIFLALGAFGLGLVTHTDLTY